eukprot:gnl/Hemi2/19268_TR6399_c0_g1_i1.p1 gnl/Hemi2/19268_TR6399_c0_g1~~gnl/Hemi2/19268_TR6399_c0_g1_i1.p1  ORF type:complete len:288 (-),score=93.79 gnl/Hemi2/19268_TR6399_c0_g1_i1:240-1103(-)
MIDPTASSSSIPGPIGSFHGQENISRIHSNHNSQLNLNASTASALSAPSSPSTNTNNNKHHSNPHSRKVSPGSSPGSKATTSQSARKPTTTASSPGRIFEKLSTTNSLYRTQRSKLHSQNISASSNQMMDLIDLHQQQYLREQEFEQAHAPPGPGTYNPISPATAVQKRFSFAQAPRPSLSQYSSSTPGVGTYCPTLRTTAKAFTVNASQRPPTMWIKNANPGPGAYPENGFRRFKAPSARIALPTAEAPPAKTPGPGEYNPMRRSAAPRFSFGTSRRRTVQYIGFG